MLLLILASGLGYKAQLKHTVRDPRGTLSSLYIVLPDTKEGGGGGVDLVPT